MFKYNTVKGELCLVECWKDEDYEERYEDGGRDLIWIDRHHSNKYGDIENYITEKLTDLSDTVYIEIHAIRSTEITRYEPGDEEFKWYEDGLSIEDMGDDCLGGGSYIWKNNTLSNRYES